MTAPAAVERCRHDLYPAACCSACRPELEIGPARTYEPYAVLTVAPGWATWCHGCSTPDGVTRWIDVGEQVGFVHGVGPCCADCCGIGGGS